MLRGAHSNLELGNVLEKATEIRAGWEQVAKW
jgi:hypothetical protein